jgi:hypothetical protein
MQIIVCPNCGKLSGFKRSLGLGGFLWFCSLPAPPSASNTVRPPTQSPSSRKSLLLLAVAGTLALAQSSCSGLHNACTTNCGGGSADSSLSITISDTPPANTSVVSFTLPIIGITLTPSSGSAVSVYSSNPSTDFELTRLQSDTNFITTQKVAAGTYTAVNVTVAAPSGVFYNSSSTAFGTCHAGSICDLAGGAATITYTFPTGSRLVLTSGAHQWLNLDFNYNSAIVTTSGIGIDVTQTGVMTATTTVPSGVPSGSFANIDDFTGSITAISSSSITLRSSIRGSLTATLSSSIPVYDPLNQCTGGGSLTCIGKGSIVSLQAVLSTTGVLTTTSLDVIDKSPTPADEVEGTIYGLCSGGTSYGIILSDSTILTASSPLTSAGFGSAVCLTPGTAARFATDDGILTGQSGVPVSAGFSSPSDFLVGQTVRAQITGATSGTNTINATGTEFILRFSRITVTVGTPSSLTFSISALPAFMASQFTVTPQVQTYINATLLEGITSISSLQSGQNVSISTLILNPATASTQFAFQAAKVRQP